MSKQTMTTLIRLMEGAGLVTRRPDPDDRRVALVALTARAREFAPVAGEVVAELERRVAERLSGDELRALRRGLRAVMDLWHHSAPSITGDIRKVVESGDTALVVNAWRLEGTGPDGAPVELGGVSADVMRRRPGGGWRVLIDDPWGAAER